MNIKEAYYDLLKANKGCLSEIELGEKLGLDENETQRIISQLLSEYKIEYKTNQACDYSLFKPPKTK
ncbi:hypothetical protein [uncultured Roseivirga sp.]|uniref:hypothetical protein n=1 Tax=uncultured Roseivirga sp. TaxID=543088 RepID=UPI000D79A0D7|nr:hypothetical protein [uncultured Roseivirga sp.]PWL28441.1 MAG: hypothetical protein DCO95_13825 [Roseivirga sp. XM-24bin3]